MKNNLVRVRTNARDTYSRPTSEPVLATFETLGINGKAGYFQKMRRTDAIIAPLMTGLVDHFSKIRWAVKPSGTTEQALDEALLWAAALSEVSCGVEGTFREGWNEFATEWFDRLLTFGCAYYQKQWKQTESGLSVHLLPIEPETINTILTDSTHTKLVHIQQVSETNYSVVPADETAYFVWSNTVGDFLGWSHLRPLVGPYLARELDIKTNLLTQNTARSFLVVRSNSPQDDSGTDWQFANETAAQVASGTTPVLLEPAHYSMRFESGKNENSAGAVERWQYYDAIIRAGLNALVENLGLSGSGSNRALAQVLEEVDESKWQASVEGFAQRLNTNALFSEWQAHLGLQTQPQIVPHFEARSLDISQQLDELRKLAEVQAVLTPEEFQAAKDKILGDVAPMEQTLIPLD